MRDALSLRRTQVARVVKPHGKTAVDQLVWLRDELRATAATSNRLALSESGLSVRIRFDSEATAAQALSRGWFPTNACTPAHFVRKLCVDDNPQKLASVTAVLVPADPMHASGGLQGCADV